ncbi:thiamine pyrophosphokinase [Colletotrichum salicis]|uniref:Thiamine pyrophosphokinase n=1 Tax=Colletotrichum salicis TaxID=1209931 RepID=A0A135UUX4_9PEZI|nr:thiamine pyrophosphokinase [Colletotrichum salicis]
MSTPKPPYKFNKLLELVKACNNFQRRSGYWEFGYYLAKNKNAWIKLGFVRPQDAQRLQGYKSQLEGYLSFDTQQKHIQLDSIHVQDSVTFVEAIKAIRVILSQFPKTGEKHEGNFGTGVWEDNDEMWPLHGFGFLTGFLCGLSPIFGIVTTGVHLNVYKREGATFRIWVAQRSERKSFARMYDQCAAGGYQYQLTQPKAKAKPKHPKTEDYDESSDVSTKACIEREVKEELRQGLPENWITRVEGPHAIQFAYIRDDRSGEHLDGFPELGVKIAYDLELKSGENPEFKKLNLNEVSSVTSFLVDEIVNLLLKDQSKPNCALVMVDFLIRLGCLGKHASAQDIGDIEKMLRKHPAVDVLPHWELSQEPKTSGQKRR